MIMFLHDHQNEFAQRDHSNGIQSNWDSNLNQPSD